MIWYRQEGNNGDGGQRELRIIKTSASAQSMRNIAKQNAVVWLKLQCHLVCHLITKQQRKEEYNVFLHGICHFRGIETSSTT